MYVTKSACCTHLLKTVRISAVILAYMQTLKIGMLGCGTVGTQVLNMLHRGREHFEALGYQVQLEGVLVRDPLKPREFEYPNVPLTNNAHFLEGVDVVIEVMGGTDTALRHLLPALEAGKTVITANKAVLAERWAALKPYAIQGNIYYEASVMAGTPVIASLSSILRASQPMRLEAVLNATCNYILSQMETGQDYSSALAQAQALGYAEDPPTLDVGGFDSAHKLTVLARLTVDPDFAYESIEIKGIDDLPEGWVEEALKEGKRVKLLCSLERVNGEWHGKVTPTAIDTAHPIAQASANFNTLVFVGKECGRIVFSGQGGGGLATASGVVGDLLDFMQGVPGQKPLAIKR